MNSVMNTLQGGSPAAFSTAVASHEPLRTFCLAKILVPVDFSECSKKALQYAIPFAQQFGAELTLLNVMLPYVPVSPISPVPMATIDPDGRSLEELRRRIVGDMVPSKAMTRAGNPWTEIVGVAREELMDLIILSTHGYTGLDHALLGSTAEKVVRHAPCPVLVVRETEREFVA